MPRPQPASRSSSLLMGCTDQGECYYQIVLAEGHSIGRASLAEVEAAVDGIMNRCVAGPNSQGGIARNIGEFFIPGMESLLVSKLMPSRRRQQPRHSRRRIQRPSTVSGTISALVLLSRDIGADARYDRSICLRSREGSSDTGGFATRTDFWYANPPSTPSLSKLNPE